LQGKIDHIGRGRAQNGVLEKREEGAKGQGRLGVRGGLGSGFGYNTSRIESKGKGKNRARSKGGVSRDKL